MKKIICLAVICVCFFLTTGFVANEAHARTYSILELNQMRYNANLPPLTGNPNIDIPRLADECRNGIQFSCTFLPQQQQYQSPQGTYQNPNERIVPLPPIQQGRVSPPYQGNVGGIMPLPPLSASPEEFNRQMDIIDRMDRLNKGNEARDAIRDERQQQSDEEQHQRDLRKIERMFN